MKKSDLLLAHIREGVLLTTSDKLKLIISLSIPSILAQITNVLMFYIDASMVGSLGADATAAIGLVEPAGWLFGSLTSAAAVGFSVQVAHFIGAKDFGKARKVMKEGYAFCLFLSLLLMLLACWVAWPLPHWMGGTGEVSHQSSVYFFIYGLAAPFFMTENLSSAMLKASGDMRHPSALSIITCMLDVVFNFLLIFPTREISIASLTFTMPGAGMGVAGAALGTTLAFVVTALVLAYYAILHNPLLSWTKHRERLSWEWGHIVNALKISAPMALQYVLMNGAQIVNTMIVAPLGNIAIASNTLAVTAESLCYMPGYGIGDAASILVGQTYGAGRKELCRSFAFMTVGLGMLVMAAMGALMWVFAPEMISMLSPVESIRELGASVLRIEAFAEPFFSAAIVTYQVCVGAGDTLMPAVMSIGSMWGIRLTLAAVLAPRYGLKGVWVAMALELTFRGTIFLIRLSRGGWLKLKPASAQQ